MRSSAALWPVTDPDVVTEATTARTFALADSGSYIRTTSGSATTLTVPANASVAFPVGTQIMGIGAGAGSLVFAAAGGVTINSKGGSLTLAGLFSPWCLTKVATNVWDLVGDLA